MPRHTTTRKGQTVPESENEDDLASLFDRPLGPIAPRPRVDATAYVRNAESQTFPLQAEVEVVPPFPRASEREPNATSSLDANSLEPPAPPTSKTVRRRYTAFVTAYIANMALPCPHGRAYRVISPNAAWVTCVQSGGELAKQPWVAARIAERMQRIAEKTDVSAAEIITGIKRIATFDVRRLYIRDADTKQWRQREPWEIDDRTAAALDELTVTELPKGRRKIKWKGAGKGKAWEMLAQVKGLLREPERPPIVANIQINF